MAGGKYSCRFSVAVACTLHIACGRLRDLLSGVAAAQFFCEPGDEVVTWFQPTINEWNGQRTVEGRLLHLERL